MWLKYVPGIEFRTDNEPFKVSCFSYFCLSKKFFKSSDSHLFFNLKLRLLKFVTKKWLHILNDTGEHGTFYMEDSRHDESTEIVSVARRSNYLGSG